MTRLWAGLRVIFTEVLRPTLAVGNTSSTGRGPKLNRKEKVGECEPSPLSASCPWMLCELVPNAPPGMVSLQWRATPGTVSQNHPFLPWGESVQLFCHSDKTATDTEAGAKKWATAVTDLTTGSPGGTKDEESGLWARKGLQQCEHSLMSYSDGSLKGQKPERNVDREA